MGHSDFPKIPDAAVNVAASGRSFESDQPRAGRLFGLALGAGLLAGVCSWLIGEAVLSTFHPPLERQEVFGQVFMAPTFENKSKADSKNAALAFAVLGGTLGLVFGATGGLVGRRRLNSVKAGVFGLLFGGLIGAAASLAFLPLYFRALDQAKEDLSRDIVLPLIVHGGIWAACGLAGGAAFGLGLGGGRGRVLNAAFGGLIGALFGAALYEMIGAMAFPQDMTTSPVSVTWITRLIARLLVATLAVLLAAAVVNMPARRPSKLRPTT